jgi:CPA1 family monovalent cation:H+ antiporter
MLILPLLSDGEYERPIDLKELEVLNAVIKYLQQKLVKNSLSEEEETAIEAIVDQYRMRIWELTTEGMTESDQKKVQELQAWTLTIEQQGLDEMYQKGEISQTSYAIYNRLLDRYEFKNEKKFLSFISLWLLIGRRLLRMLLHPKRFWRLKRNRDFPKNPKINVNELKYIYDMNTLRINQLLESKEEKVSKTVLSFLVGRREMLLKRMYHRNVVSMVSIEKSSIYERELLNGYTYERRTIDEFEREEKISSLLANSYRQKVNLLESFAISKNLH